MAAYAVTDYVTPPKNKVVDVTALLETKIDTIDNGKTLHLKGVIKQGDMFVGYLIYDD